MKVVDGWKMESLGDQLDMIRNGYSGKQVEYFTDFPVSRIETISDGTINLNKVGYVDFIPDSYPLRSGDLLLSNINSLKHIGKIAQVGEDIRLFHGMNLLLLRPAEQVDKNFLYYKLINAKPWFEKMAAQAINQASLNQGTIRQLQLELPNQKSEQVKIAEILSTVDRAIEQTESLIVKQKRIKTGLMQDLLTRGIDECGNRRSELTHQFKDSPLGRIPAGWKVVLIKEIAEVSYGISDAIDLMNRSGILTITLPCVSPDGNLTINSAKLVYTPHKAVKERDMLQRGDLLFNWRNGSQNHLGKTAYFNTSGRLTHVGFLLKVRTFKRKCASRFLWYLINDIKAKGFFFTAKIQVNNTFNSNELRNVEIKLPSFPEQKLIREKLDAVEKVKSESNSELEKLKIIKTALMQDLLTGKKRVTSLLNETEMMNG